MGLPRVEEPLVAYGEGDGPPNQWPSGNVWPRRGCSVDSSEQQCDDENYMEWRWQRPDGLYSNVEGEFIGDFC